MATVVSVKVPTKGISAEILVNFGDSLPEAVELFGEETVFNRYIRGIKVEAQGAARTMLAAGKTPEEVADYMANTWKPGEGADAMTTLLAKIANASDEEKAKILAALTA